MQAIIERELLSRARAYTKNQDNWHFHLLPMDCRFNPVGKYNVIQLQHAMDDPAYAIFHHPPDKEYLELRNLMYGEGVIEQEPAQEVPALSEIQAHAISLSEEGIPWHYHHFPPGCRLNITEKESHCIVLEDPRHNVVFRAVVGNKVIDALRNMNKLQQIELFKRHG